MLNKKTFIVIFALIFVFEMLIGLLSNVSMFACLSRALIGSLFFTGLLYAALKFIRNCVINDLIKNEKPPEDEESEQKIDITVSDDNLDISDLYDNPKQSNESTPNVEVAQSDSLKQMATAKTSDDEFVPLTAQQIDPQVNEIINNNPERLAQIVRKMGFEDES